MANLIKLQKYAYERTPSKLPITPIGTVLGKPSKSYNLLKLIMQIGKKDQQPVNIYFSTCLLFGRLPFVYISFVVIFSSFLDCMDS